MSVAVASSLTVSVVVALVKVGAMLLEVTAGEMPMLSIPKIVQPLPTLDSSGTDPVILISSILLKAEVAPVFNVSHPPPLPLYEYDCVVCAFVTTAPDL